MPDHVHFIVHILEAAAASRSAAQGGQPPAPTLPRIVGTFKTIVATSTNAVRGTTGASVWQRNYYEHIIRNEEDLDRIRDYIRNNLFVAHEHRGEDLAEAWRRKW